MIKYCVDNKFLGISLQQATETEWVEVSEDEEGDEDGDEDDSEDEGNSEESDDEDDDEEVEVLYGFTFPSSLSSIIPLPRWL